MLNRRRFNQISLGVFGFGMTSCSQSTYLTNTSNMQSSSHADLTIWWEQGFLPEENEQINQLIRKWEQKSGKSVDLKLLPVALIDQQLANFIEQSEFTQIPDIVYSVGVDASLAPKLAWQNRLVDLTDVITPIKEKYTSIALSHVFYRNQVRQERGYYAMPLWQSDDYIHYWESMIEEIGFTQQDIPRDWHQFWGFWHTAQDKLRAMGRSQIYGVGLCMSAIGFDTYTSLRMFMDAHDVAVVNEAGDFLLKKPENRHQFIEVLQEFTNFYLQGYTPPVSATWSGAGNNNSLLNSEILMTHNLTMSIPLTQKLTNPQYDRDAIARYRQIVTIDRPLKVNGEELLTRKGTKQAIAPKNSKDPTLAKEFLSYLAQPDNLMFLLKGFKGRVFPVMPELLQDPFWNDPNDPHLSAALKIFARPSFIPYEVMHSSFSEVQNRQLWAKAVLKVIQDKASIIESVDWAIAQIQDIWQAWEIKQ
ncbi:ABC transporter substrate-binding protein [Pseudanabaena sp. Chao 1811]|uniref:ABC transporter substrate-binding protein n=1 Tax=Pseudanabaena sp. Chao 1811 TaxID=2963092 RepID=UPI0022F39CC8|nr:ABC transporter substrate-binding protein [Pseudanabaena sp. Chao 1811]